MRRELLFDVPTVGLTAVFVSIEPFVCFGFGLLFLTMVAVELSELSWIERFEQANGVTVVRVVGVHWRSPRFALAPPLKDTAPAQRKLAHAQSEAARRAP
jgi:hypothetical protein